MEEREGCRARGVSFFFFSIISLSLLRSRHAHINECLLSYRIKMRKAARRGIPYSRSLEIGPQMAQAHDFEFDFEDGLEVAYEEEDEDETEALEMGEHWDERFRRVISLEQQVSRKDEKETHAGIGKRVMETPLGHEARGQQRDDEVEMISPEGNGNLHVHIGPAS